MRGVDGGLWIVLRQHVVSRVAVNAGSRLLGPVPNRFTVEAVIGGKVYGRGKGFSKQNAAQAAAQEALRMLEEEMLRAETLNAEP